jgi:hypothetical protein
MADIRVRVSTFGLINGGLAGLVWTYLATFVGFLTVIASMAEMASMWVSITVGDILGNNPAARAPTSGGQYHWVSEFSPRSCQKFLSYVTGRG